MEDEVYPTEIVESDETTKIGFLKQTELAKMATQTGLMVKPEATAIVDRLAKVAETARHQAIYRTQVRDWILSKAKDGSRTAFPNVNACRAIAEIFQIRILNVSPVRVEKDETGRTIGTISGDGVSLFTGSFAANVVVSKIGGKNNFAGRDPGEVGDVDLKTATRTALESRIVKLLANVGRLTIDELAGHFGVSVDDIERGATLGQGYGKSKERENATREAGGDEPIAEGQRKLLWAKVFAQLETLGFDGGKEERDARAQDMIRAVKSKFGLKSLNDMKRSDVTAAVEFIATLAIDANPVGAS